MTDNEQRIAIAEACGWTCEQWASGSWQVYRPGNPRERVTDGGYGSREAALRNATPDYLNDWNAMRAAVNSLSVKDRMQFLYHLDQATRGRHSDWLPARIVDSTLHEWAEAFLRTVGKWVD